MAGHCSRPAMAPEIAHVMTAGSARLTTGSTPGRFVYGRPRRSWRSTPGRFAYGPHRRSYGHHAISLPRPVDALGRRQLERAADCGPRLARVDDVVDHGVAGRDVDVDDLAELLDQLLTLGRRVLGLLHLLAEDDLDRALGAHHADLGARPGDDQVGVVGTAAHHVVAGAVGLAQDHG